MPSFIHTHNEQTGLHTFTITVSDSELDNGRVDFDAQDGARLLDVHLEPNNHTDAAFAISAQVRA